MIKPLITECIICGGDAEYEKDTVQRYTGYQDVMEEFEVEGWQCLDPDCGHFEEIIPELEGDVEDTDNDR